MPESLPTQSSMIKLVGSQSKDFFLKICVFLLWSIPATLIIALLFGYMESTRELLFVPSKKFSFNFGHVLNFLRNFGIWYGAILLISSIVTYFISKSVSLSKIFLLLNLVAVFGFSLVMYWASKEVSELGPLQLLAILSWITFPGLTYLLTSSIFGKANLLTSKIFWLSGILALLLISSLSFLATSHIRAKTAKSVEFEKSRTQAIYSNPSFPVFEPTYFPPRFGGFILKEERAGEPTDQGIEYVVHERSFKYTNTSSFLKYDTFYINEMKLKNLALTDQEFLQRDLEKLETSQKEILTIAGYPAIYSPLYGETPRLYVYREGVRIEIYSHSSQQSNQTSRDELIKIAESLRQVN